MSFQITIFLVGIYGIYEIFAAFVHFSLLILNNKIKFPQTVRLILREMRCTTRL